MKLTIVVPDLYLMLDGDRVSFTQDDLPELLYGVHAVQYHDDSGHIEYTDTRCNSVLANADEFMPWVLNTIENIKKAKEAAARDTGPA